jgi:sec-independent protein translocase protein TatA
MSPGRDGFGVFDMGTFGPIHWLVVAVLVLLLFGGRGKLSSIMGDAAKGVRAFREGLKGEEDAHEEAPPPAKPISNTAAKTAPKPRAKSKA